MDTMKVMSKFKINKLNRAQIEEIDRYNKRQNVLFYIALALTNIALLISYFTPKLKLLIMIILCIWCFKGYLRIYLKKNLFKSSTLL